MPPIVAWLAAVAGCARTATRPARSAMLFAAINVVAVTIFTCTPRADRQPPPAKNAHGAAGRGTAPSLQGAARDARPGTRAPVTHVDAAGRSRPPRRGPVLVVTRAATCWPRAAGRPRAGATAGHRRHPPVRDRSGPVTAQPMLGKPLDALAGALAVLIVSLGALLDGARGRAVLHKGTSRARASSCGR